MSAGETRVPTVVDEEHIGDDNAIDNLKDGGGVPAIAKAIPKGRKHDQAQNSSWLNSKLNVTVKVKEKHSCQF